VWILFYLLPGFGVGGGLTWLLLMFTPMAGDWTAILLVGGLTGAVWTLWQTRRRHRRRALQLLQPITDWQHGEEVVVRGRLICLEHPLETPLGNIAALYGYRADWQTFEPGSGSSRSTPSRQAEGYAMTVCAIAAHGQQIPLRGVPDTGGSQRRSSADLADLERLARYWIDHRITPFETGIEAAKEAFRVVRRLQRNGRVPEFAGLGQVRTDTLFPNSAAGKQLKAALNAAIPDPPAIARLLQQNEGVLHEEWIEPNAEVVVVGRWNAAAGRIDTGATSLVTLGDPVWSGKLTLGAERSQIVLRLPAADTPVPAPGHRGFAFTLMLWLAVTLPVAWFVAPLATSRPQLHGPLELVDVGLIAMGDLQPLVEKLIEPPWPPEQIAVMRARVAAGEDIPREWQWALEEVARSEVFAPEARLASLDRVLDVVRPDLNRLGASALTPLYVTRSHGRFALLDTRGASMASLLRHGADPNFATEQGDTALSAAASSCDVARVRELLAAGASPNPRRSAIAASAARIIPYTGYAATPFMEDCVATTRVLASAGARGAVAYLHRAISQRQPEALAVLIEAGLDINEDDPELGTPLEAAVFAQRDADDEVARADHARAIQVLNAAGARPWQATASTGQPVDAQHPAAIALNAVYQAIQTRDEPSVLRLYPSHGRWRAERSAEQLAEFHLPEPLPPFTVEGYAAEGRATLRYFGKRANGKGFDWYAQMVLRNPDAEGNGEWILRRRWGGEPRPF